MSNTGGQVSRKPCVADARKADLILFLYDRALADATAIQILRAALTAKGHKKMADKAIQRGRIDNTVDRCLLGTRNMYGYRAKGWGSDDAPTRLF